MAEMARNTSTAPGAWRMHGLMTLPFWLALAGVVVAYVFYMLKPADPGGDRAALRLRP